MEERVSEGLPFDGVETPVRGGCRREGGEIGLPCLRGRGEKTGTGVEGNSLAGISGGETRSARDMSGAGRRRRSSSDKDGVASVDDDAGADSMEGAERLLARCWAAVSWSLRMLISSLASRRP